MLRALGVAIGLILIWQAIILIFAPPPYFLPSPLAVLAALRDRPDLWRIHAVTTLVETIAGLVIGTVVGRAVVHRHAPWFGRMSHAMPCPGSDQRPMDRRDFLWRLGGGLGGVALAHLLGSEGALAAPVASGLPHHAPRAKRVVQLFMSGAASQCDTFDYKPALIARHGQKFDPGGKVELFQSDPGAVMRSPWNWKQYGQSGKWVSDLVPHLAGRVHQPIESAQRVKGPLHQRTLLFRVREIARERDCATVAGTDDLLELVVPSACDRDLTTAREQRLGDRLTDPRASTGHQHLARAGSAQGELPSVAPAG